MRTLLFYICVLCLQNANASEALPKTGVISLSKISGLLHESDPTLPYNKVLASLNMKVATDIQYSFFPATRSAFVFNNKKAICLFPASLTTNLDRKNALIETIPLNNAQAFFLSSSVRSAKDILAKDAEKLIIGFRRGNTFGGNIKHLSHHTLLPLESDEQSANMFYRGRIDTILAYMPDSLAILNMHPERPLTYSKESLFYSQADSFLCHKTSEGVALVAALNEEISAMRRSGELKRLLGDAFIEIY